MFKLAIGPDAHLALIEPRHARELNQLIKGSYEHLHEWSNWLKNNDQTVDGTEEWIKKNQLSYGSGSGYEIGIWHEGNMAGQIGYNYFDRENHRTEIGYWLGATFQGKGLITRGCRALIGHAFDNLDVKRIEIRCCTENLKSRKIPEKFGFKLEGVARNGEWLHDRFCDLAIYAMLAEEWNDIKQNASK